MKEFVHEWLPQRVVFCTNTSDVQIVKKIRQEEYERVMVMASEFEMDLAQRIAKDLPVVHWFDDVRMHVTVDAIERALEEARRVNADVLVSVGGGSTTGLAKAIALETNLPIIAVPTTYAGSEATNVWGRTADSVKTTGKSSRVLPRVVLYDAALTVSLPVEMSVASGLNGIAHGVDSLWAPNANPFNTVLAIESVGALADGIRKIRQEPDNLEARTDALYGTYLAGVAFAAAGSGMHHKICHVLGGMYDLPHAQTHSVILPYVLAFNSGHIPAIEQRLADVLSAPSALEGLEELRSELSAPRALHDYGFAPDMIPRVVDAVLKAVPENNPRPVTAPDITRLLELASEGGDPRELQTTLERSYGS